MYFPQKSFNVTFVNTVQLKFETSHQAFDNIHSYLSIKCFKRLNDLIKLGST